MTQQISDKTHGLTLTLEHGLVRCMLITNAAMVPFTGTRVTLELKREGAGRPAGIKRALEGMGLFGKERREAAEKAHRGFTKAGTAQLYFVSHYEKRSDVSTPITGAQRDAVKRLVEISTLDDYFRNAALTFLEINK